MQQLSESVSDSQLLCPLSLSFGISFAHSQLVLFSIDQFSSGQVIGVLFIMWKKEVGNFAVQRLVKSTAYTNRQASRQLYFLDHYYLSQ
jgi:hypothetical protein